MSKSIGKLRNIGISAHIDSGKTTLTERILYYCKKIHAMHEVRGTDGKGATMDSMELEKERGITIASAATSVDWKDHTVSIIDTPGHVDFTIEVERALRVLDGAILVLCAVGGVQSQTMTVDRQLKRYKVPRIAFVNKLDRTGSNPYLVHKQLCEKLGHHAVLMQIPMVEQEKLIGLIDLIRMKALYFDGDDGSVIREEPIPQQFRENADEYHDILLNEVSHYSDELAEAYLEDAVNEQLIHEAVRMGTLSLKLLPVFMGTAYKNKGVQPLLDAVTRYLPCPTEVTNYAFDINNDEEKEVPLTPDPSKPLVALAFKLEDSRFGQLTYVRLYQGTVKKGGELCNSRTGKTFKVGRLMRMHADTKEEIDEARCGDIVALFGIDCASGDTFNGAGCRYSMAHMHVPEPVISISIEAADKKSADNMAKALNRFTKEDPTFRTYLDEESGQTIISGMGELHLDVYLERMRREYGVSLNTGMPQVAYRERIKKSVPFDYTHKKQTGGAGQFARVAGTLEPDHEKEYEFVDEIKGGVIPVEFIPSCDSGFQSCLEKGTLIGFPIVNVKVTINDGKYHPVDSSQVAFKSAAIGGFWQAYQKAGPEIIEPIMRVSVEGPPEFQGNVIASITQRRGIISSTSEDERISQVEGDVPLSEMFGYSTALRSLTQGKSEFTMEFSHYDRVPEQLAEKLKKEFENKRRKISS
ncbi:MAG: elongation factor G [Chitinivibrionales bacterium]|nr:elongation factor G [Chitinivibrionales bacterium]